MINQVSTFAVRASFRARKTKRRSGEERSAAGRDDERGEAAGCKCRCCAGSLGCLSRLADDRGTAVRVLGEN